jgi:hypothetical protein
MMIDYDKQYAKDSGEFYLPETKKYFSFRPATKNSWAEKHNLIHEIDVSDGILVLGRKNCIVNSIRFAIVRKSIAYVAIDEDQYGNPVLEKWQITKRRIFQSVRAI